MGDPRDHAFPSVKHDFFKNSNGGRFACDQWKAPSIDEQIVHVRRSCNQKKVENKTIDLATYNGLEHNWIFWYPTTNNISYPFLLLSCHKKLLPAFIDLQQNQLMDTQLAKQLQNPKFTPYIHLNGQKQLAT